MLRGRVGAAPSGRTKPLRCCLRLCGAPSLLSQTQLHHVLQSMQWPSATFKGQIQPDKTESRSQHLLRRLHLDDARQLSVACSPHMVPGREV